MPQEKRSCPCKRLPMCLSSFTAAEYGDIHSLEQSMKRHSSCMDRVDSGGYTPLHLAAQNGHTAATSLLLQLGAKPDSNECGATPLHRASFSGAISTMRLLLENTKCDLLVQDTSFGDKMTPLHKAAAGGRYLAVKLLLDALRERRLLLEGLNALDSLGRSPLDVAIELSKNQQQEQQSVKRWDVVAGGVADWCKCVELLNSMEKESQNGNVASVDGGTITRLPALPKHLAEGFSCLDCSESRDGSCLTTSWESAFRSALLSSIPSSANLAVPTYCTVIPPTRPQFTEQQDNGTNASVNESKVNEQSVDTTVANGKECDSVNTTAGSRSCDTCGVPSFALYPSQSGRLVCRTCFKPTRKARRKVRSATSSTKPIAP